MNRILLVLLLCIVPLCALCQQDTASPPKIGWSHSVVAGLTATQISFTDWAQGGENALSYTLSIEGKSTNNLEKFNWANSYKFAFGQARLSSQGLRKSDDKIDLESVINYKLDGIIDPYFSATLKTQFTRGYKYDAAGISTAVSGFFDPGYLMQTAGFGYSPMPEVKTRLGAGLREIIASKFASFYTDDPATPGVEKTKIDVGLESVTEVSWKVADNILLTSKLELFDAIKKFDEVIVHSDNSLAMKVNKYIVVNVNLVLINERRITPKTQVKQAMSLGLTYTLI